LPGGKRPIELIKVETNELQNVPDAASAMERAITVNKADFVIGSWRTEAVLAMQDVAMDHKKIFFSQGAHPRATGRTTTGSFIWPRPGRPLSWSPA
jgi:branched-chain amino acid transport system substrate-binding protein